MSRLTTGFYSSRLATLGLTRFTLAANIGQLAMEALSLLSLSASLTSLAMVLVW